MSLLSFKKHEKAHPMLHVSDHPFVHHKLTLLRKKETGTKEFRELVREISLMLGYEALKDLPTENIEIETPLEKMKAPQISGKKVCFISVLRAGEGMIDGMKILVPAARIGHIGMMRDAVTHEPHEYLRKLPGHIDKRLVVVVDPMLATGGSATAALDILKQAGARTIKFVCILACPEGVARLAKDHPDVPVYTACVDRELDENKYIRPGLGDAGDRLFGTT